MQDQELKNIWQNSASTYNIRLQLSELNKNLSQTVSDIEKEIKVRDRNEIIASIIGIFIFGYFTYEIPYPISKVACLFAVLWFGYVIFKFKKSHKEKVDVDISLPLKEQLAQQKVNMNLQKKLLLSVPYWYVLPPYIMNIILFIGFENPEDYGWDHFLAGFFPYDPVEKIFPLLFVTLLYGFIIWINIKTANSKFKNVIEDIEKMEKGLAEEKN